MIALALVALLGCRSSKGTQPSTSGSSNGTDGSAVVATDPVADAATAGSAAPVGSAGSAGSATAPPLDDGITYADPSGGSPGTVKANTVYRSDCSTTHPIARDVCSGAAIERRGLKSCASLGVKMFKPCEKGAPTCYVERKCSDGRVVPSDFLECAAKQNSGCFTRSSRIFKDDIEYLDDRELADLASQIEQLKLSRFRYKGSGDKHLGFIIEDAPDAPWVTADGRRVDLYSLLSASIAAIQRQDARIRRLESDIEILKNTSAKRLEQPRAQ
jgi:hypothetical protein